MSKTQIPSKVKIRLWGQAAGRCQYPGCNLPLYRDQLTKTQFNTAYIAHIIADEPDGPRGDPILSPKLAKDISNLMLLCDSHHRLIDEHDIAGHPVERLRAMKAAHEELMERLTNIQKSRQTHIVLFGANIGQSKAGLNFEDAAADLSDGWYPAESRAISLGLSNSSFEDHDGEYWRVEEANLKRNFEVLVRQRIGSNEVKHLSVFALAPQPLLMLFGKLLSDITEAQVYARHRHPPGWKWPKGGASVDFKIIKPERTIGEPALVFGLSAVNHPDRIKAILGNDASIWIVTIDQPFNDFLKAPGDLVKFKEASQKLLNEIKLKHGQNALLHVFPAMPAALAVEFGRSVMPKADLRMQIYDQNHKTQGFAKALRM